MFRISMYIIYGTVNWKSHLSITYKKNNISKKFVNLIKRSYSNENKSFSATICDKILKWFLYDLQKYPLLNCYYLFKITVQITLVCHTKALEQYLLHLYKSYTLYKTVIIKITYISTFLTTLNIDFTTSYTNIKIWVILLKTQKTLDISVLLSTTNKLKFLKI